MATKEQLRALRKKHHLGEFRKVYKSRSIKRYMAKRKSRKKSYSKFGLKSALIGGAGTLLYENYVSPMLPLQQPIKNVVEAGAGYYLSKKSGLTGDFGKVLFIVNAYSLMTQLLLPSLSGIAVSQSTGGVY